MREAELRGLFVFGEPAVSFVGEGSPNRRPGEKEHHAAGETNLESRISNLEFRISTFHFLFSTSTAGFRGSAEN